MPIDKDVLRARLAKGRATVQANREARKAAQVGILIDETDEVLESVAAAAPAAPAAQRAQQRTPLRNGEALGRNGEVLSRKRTATGDIFAIDPALIPVGWSYQWCAVSIVGNTEILLDQNLMFAENGWRAVPSDRYPGKFMPAGHKGSIIRGGQILMERPEKLSQEAQAEDVKAAKQLISDRNDSLKLSGMKKQMADGFEMSQKYRGTGGDIRMSIDRALDLPPQAPHEVADE